MFKLKKFAFLYLFAAVFFAFTAGEHFFANSTSQPQFEHTLQQLKYQLDYIDVYVSAQNVKTQEIIASNDSNEVKTVYLTFDDGPSARTLEILDILDEYDIKATFFILSDEKDSSREIVKRIYDEGHAIGVHSHSHSYENIYKSVDSFLDDFEICFNYIKDIIGESPSIFRFPGGSVNSYNKKICKPLTEEMTRRGFTYFDWNVSADDAVKGYTEESIYTNVVNGCKNRNVSVVLMHDSTPKKDTVAALKRIIPALMEQGYHYDRLDETAQPTVFKIE